MIGRTLWSMYDFTGNWALPYKQAGWDVIQIDIKNGLDVMTMPYRYMRRPDGMLIAQPCTDYAVSGARHFEAKDADGRTAESQALVAKTYEILEYFKPGLSFWALENPKTRIHKLNPWIGQRPKFIFNPCDFAGYDPNPDASRYNKETWLFGKFNDPVPKYMEPIYKENPGWKNLGGKSEKTKELRSITPLGFANAFYQHNN